MTTEQRSRPGNETEAAEDQSGGRSTPSIADTSDKTLEAVVIAVTVHKCVRTVTVRCPFCGKTHTHGWPDGQTPGHRLAHCGWPAKTFGAGYTIVLAVAS